MSCTPDAPSTAATADPADPWAAWLLERRFGGDRAAWQRMLPVLSEFRDTVLRGARIEPGDTVLDVGCGDGLLGIGALPEVGPAGQVIFSDISAALLDRCREVAGDLGGLDRCRFVQAGLPHLPEISTASVDVAMTRSVLIYVEDKVASFATFHRVLRPGGRLSIFEPINRFSQPPDEPDRLWGFDITGLAEIASKVKDAFRQHLPDQGPMTDFDERDLLAAAERAGFTQVRLDYRAEVGPDPEPVTWEELLRRAPNPLVPTLGEVLDTALGPAEVDRLAAHVQREIAAGRRHRRLATAYLTATRSARRLREPSRSAAHGDLLYGEDGLPQ
jgi:arsenite methyltransferase